jgi:hypothetical protein
MGIIKIYNDKKWTLQFLDALYNSIDYAAMHNTISTFLPLYLGNKHSPRGNLRI